MGNVVCLVCFDGSFLKRAVLVASSFQLYYANATLVTPSLKQPAKQHLIEQNRACGSGFP